MVIISITVGVSYMKQLNDLTAPRRWAINRIVSVAILMLLVLGGVAYGVYNLTSGSSSNLLHKTKTTTNESHLASPVRQKKTNNSSNSYNQTNLSTGSIGAASNKATGLSVTPSSGQLTNTGPGNVAFVGFGIVTVISTIFHYGWRKRRTSA